MTRLANLKADAQRHYTEPLDWHDRPQFGKSAWADVDHHTVSVMVNPPAGCWQIARVWSDHSEPLVGAPQMEPLTLAEICQLAMKL